MLIVITSGKALQAFVGPKNWTFSKTWQIMEFATQVILDFLKIL